MSTYKTAPTFIIPLDKLKQYRASVMGQIEADRVNLMANGRVLLWVDEEIKKLEPKEKKESLNKEE